MKTTIWTVFVLFMVFSLSMGNCTADGVGGCTGCHAEIVEDFKTSLHYTASGMYDGYENGAAGHFGINMSDYYDKFSCSKCHVTTCTTCHIGYSATSGHDGDGNITNNTCRLCHDKKQSSTYAGYMPMRKSKGPAPDIHHEAGMICTDCHPSSDLHGTGVKYDTQLEAVSVKCEDCHNNPGKTVNGTEVMQYSSESHSHSLHGDKLSCISCHSSWILNCQNCHLEDRKGMTVARDVFCLAKDENGQLTTFFKMETEYKGENHTAFGEWYGHTATDNPKDCVFCHENAEEILLKGYAVGENVQIRGSFADEETIERVLNAEIVYETPTSTTDDTTSDKIPGFEAVFSIAGLLAVSYLVLKRRE